MNCWEEQPSRWLTPTVVAAGTGWKQAGTVHWVLAVAELGALRTLPGDGSGRSEHLPQQCELAPGLSSLPPPPSFVFLTPGLKAALPSFPKGSGYPGCC